jgi:hypothetical protein
METQAAGSVTGPLKCVRYYNVFNGDADGLCALHQRDRRSLPSRPLSRVGGGGRSVAAGIDRLERSRREEFLDAFCAAWPVHVVCGVF